MKRILIGISLLLAMVGCAPPGSEHYNRIVKMELGRLQEPTVPFSSYSQFQLEELEVTDEIRQQPEKMRVADDVAKRLEEKLRPLLQEWNGKGTGKGTLVIKPKLKNLYVVSAGSRFWLGVWSGSSRIGLDLDIRDGETGRGLARPRIDLSADANSGAWSIGESDRNMLNYTVDIAYEYLKKYY